MRYRNPKWLDAGTIDAEVEHPEFGWVPITLRCDDPETAALFEQVAEALADRPEWVLPLAQQAPPPVGIEELRANAVIGKPELLFILHKRFKLITEAEAREAATNGTPPAAFEKILAAIPEDERLLAELKWAADPTIKRNNSMLIRIATAMFGQRADEVLDVIFGLAEQTAAISLPEESDA